MPDKWDQYAVQSAPASDKWDQYAVQPTAPDLSNKQGQGTYQMSDKSGKTVGVPYGQVQQAAQQGYQFAGDEDRFRYAKDNAADPNRKTSYSAAPGYTPPDESKMSAPMQAVAGVAKGAGALAKPFMDAVNYGTGGQPEDVDRMLHANGGIQTAAKVGTIGSAIAAGAAAAPIATAGGAVGGTLGSGAGQFIGDAAGMDPGKTQLLSDAMGIVGGAGGSIAAGPAVNALNYKAKITDAKSLFGIVAKDANKVPIQLDHAQEGALNLMEWQKQTTLGPTVNKFLNRITDPNKGPVTYEEARRAYQLLGKLSVDESIKMNPAVKRDLVQMVVGLKQDIGNAADTVGQASNYYQAMGDMATGKRLEGWANFAKKWAIKAALGGGIMYDAYKHYQ